MKIFSRLLHGSKNFNSAIIIIQDVGTRIGDKYGHNNILKYLAIFSAGEFIKESMNSGKYQYYGEKYQGTNQQQILRRHLSDGMNRLVKHGLDAKIWKDKVSKKVACLKRLH